MVDISKVEQFRTSKEPIVGLWSIDGHEAYGSLSWRENSPELRIVVHADGPPEQNFSHSENAILHATKPPAKALIQARIPKFGVITLIDCFQYNVSASYNIGSDKTSYSISLAPTQIWLGAPKHQVEGRVSYVHLRDTRLAGYFGSPGLEKYDSWGGKAKEAFDALGDPDEIWVLRTPDGASVTLKGTPFNLRVGSGVSNSVSSTTGHILRSHTNLTLETGDPTTIEEASQAIVRIEQILSVFALEPFSFQIKEFQTNPVVAESPPEPLLSVSLVWQLGEDHSLFNPPMRHQILIDLTHHETLQRVCDGWFDASNTVRLSRWLFVRALRETEDGLARFIAVAQAFEVLGRELATSSSMPKSDLKHAVEIVRNGLSGKFEDGFVDRVISLIQSSNRASFRDVLHSMLAAANPEPEHDLLPFCKKVADTRNAVVHMTTNSNSALTEAFARVNKLSLQVSFWYAVVQANQLGVRIADIGTFLFNNRNARHGLPNELLERN